MRKKWRVTNSNSTCIFRGGGGGTLEKAIMNINSNTDTNINTNTNTNTNTTNNTINNTIINTIHYYLYLNPY